MSTPIMNDFWACEEDEEICVYKTGNWGGNLFYIVLLFLFFVSQFFLAYGDLASEYTLKIFSFLSAIVNVGNIFVAAQLPAAEDKGKF